MTKMMMMSIENEVRARDDNIPVTLLISIAPSAFVVYLEKHALSEHCVE